MTTSLFRSVHTAAFRSAIFAFASVACSTPLFAAISASDDLESSRASYVAGDSSEDASALATYETTPAISAPYPFSGFGSSYLAIDTGDTRIQRSLSTSATVYFDMAVQFTYSAEAPAPQSDDKFLVFADTNGYLCVISGTSSEDTTAVTNVTTSTVTEGVWCRLTVNAVVDGSTRKFKVLLNGVTAQTSGGVSEFYSLNASTSMSCVGFVGTGSLDDFVARTTDPNISSGDVKATIGGEGYASLDAAISDLANFAAATNITLQANSTLTLAANSSAAITVPSGFTLDLTEGDYTFSGTFSGAGTVKLNAKPKAYSAATNTSLFSADWTGICQLNWNPGGTRFVFNEFGNTNSFVEITAEFNAFPSTQWSSGTAPTIDPGIILSARWYVKDGWAGANTPTTIRLLTGTCGLLCDGSQSGNDTSHLYYNINTISNFTGFLTTGGNNSSSSQNATGRGSFKIGNIVTSTEPSYGDKLVSIDVYNASVFKYRDLDQTTVNGSSAYTLFVDDETSGSRGIYIAAAKTEIAGEEKYWTSSSSAISTANDAVAGAYESPSLTIYDSTEPASPWTPTAGGAYVYSGCKAYIGETGYFSVSNALAAAGAAETTIRLVAADAESIELPSNITLAVADDIVFSGVLYGAGKIKYTKAPASFVKASLLGDSWTGTYVAAYDITADNSFNVNAYGTANSKFEVAAGNTLTGYFNLNNSSVIPELVVSGTITLNNGYSTGGVTIPKLSGTGIVSINIYYIYNITSLDGWTGKIVLTSWNTKNIEQYGCAGSTIELAGDESGYLGRNSDKYGNISASVHFTGTATFNNGWPLALSGIDWTDDRVLKINEAKVDGHLALIYPTDSTTWINYRQYVMFSSLDASGIGSIEVGNNFGLRIDAVDFDAAPSGTGRQIALELTGTDSGNYLHKGVLYGPSGVAGEAIPVTVGGVATGQTLVYVADAEAPGLYLAPSARGFRAEIR